MNTLKWLMPSEKEVENGILYFLTNQVGVFAFKINTIGVYDQRGGFYRKLSKYVLPGTPDILACVNVNGVGVFVGFEVKSEKGRQSKTQKDFQEALQAKGKGFYFLVRSIKEAEDALKKVKECISQSLSCGPVG